MISADAKALGELIENALITAPEGASIRSISEGLVSGDYAEVIAAHRDEWILELIEKWRKRLRLKNAQGLTVAEVMEREAGIL